MARRRKAKKAKLLVAPGREPDELDVVRQQIQANDTYSPLKKLCRICKEQMQANRFDPEEWRKMQPTCRCCADRPLRKSTGALPNLEPKKPPPNAWIAYRIEVAEDDQANWHLAKILDDEGEGPTQ